MNYFHSMIAFIGECELKTRDELPEHVLTSVMVSYIKRKQDEILSENEVQSIVAQIENNRFSKSWRTNQAHKAYLKDNHNQADKAVKTKSKIESAIKAEPTIIEIAKSKEVRRWSGQTEIEPVFIDEILILPFNIQPSNDDKVFINPFEIEEVKLKPKQQTCKATIIKQVPDISEQALACPNCHSEMAQRVAKKGERQGQVFYGCVQFPKCRGVVNG